MRKCLQFSPAGRRVFRYTVGALLALAGGAILLSELLAWLATAPR